MRAYLTSGRPLLVLAPMQDVTDLPFMRLMARYGGPDVFVTEYFRVHRDSHLETHIVESIIEHGTGRPVFAQMIGHDIPALVRTARALQELPIAGVDLNLGCPAPIVCRKDAGGGLLRQPERIDAILRALRDTVTTRLTVKCRIGYESGDEFARLLDVFAKHALDGVTVHGRTVADGYRGVVKPGAIAQAVNHLACPVIANGNVWSVADGVALHTASGAAGLMCGRGAIRHPWLFARLRAHFAGTPPPETTHRDLLTYIQALWDETAAFQKNYVSTKQVGKMKKYMGFIMQGLPEAFDFALRRAKSESEFFSICREHLEASTPLYDSSPV
jgi:tRNA-dihydrouridine synthase